MERISLPEPKIEETQAEIRPRTREELEQGLQYATNTGKLLEKAYWENELKEFDQEIKNKLIDVQESKEKKADRLLKDSGKILKIAESEGLGLSPREKKRDTLLNKYAQFKRRASYIQDQILTKINNDPAFLKEDYPDINQFFSNLKISPKDERKARYALMRCTGFHQAIEKASRDFPEASDMYEHLFLKRPVGEVEIFKGPISLYVRCHNLGDYAWIYNQSFSNASIDSLPPLTQEEVDKANRSGGVSISGCAVPDLRGAIIVEKALGRPFDADAMSVMVHEEEHVIRRIINSSWKSTRPTKGMSNKFYNDLMKYGYGTDAFLENAPEEVIRKFIKHQIKRSIEQNYLRGADEVLAYFKDGQHSFPDILVNLKIPESKGGLYDYFSETAEDVVKYMLVGTSVNKTLILDECEKARQEYHELLSNAVAALDFFHKKTGFTKNETIAFFDKIPLEKWYKSALRYVTARGF